MPLRGVDSHMTVELGETTLTERIVLLGLARQADRDETPATSAELQTECEACLDDVEVEVVGRMTEADVTRALNALAAGSLVEEAVQRQSPVGKGRPTYTLATDAETTLAALSDDDRFRPVVEGETN